MFGKGDKVPLLNGGSVEIKDKLGEGGQGIVFKVSYNGKDYALKWYHPNVFKENKAKFYENLKKNVESGSPSDKFLWPLYLTAEVNDSFGYVMDLRPSGYEDFTSFLRGKSHFLSFSAQNNAALSITNAFRDLHRAGYSYQDLNDGNFFINPKDGDVLVCDNDNVAADGKNLGIAGKARYMAPEVVRGISKPDKYSDRFSLAVVLFRLFFIDHPLEGKRALQAVCLTPKDELVLFGKEPIFMLDPNRDENRPVRGVHNNVLRLWNLYPEFLRNNFIKSFSEDAMWTGDKGERMDLIRQTRLLDNAWQETFVNLGSCIVRCSCGKETIIDPGKDCKCIRCGAPIPKTFVLSCLYGKYVLPLFPGVKLYRCHTDGASDDYSAVSGEVTTHPAKPGVWGLKNLDGKIWKLKLTDGSETDLAPGKNAPLLSIDSIAFDARSKGEIKR